MTAGRRNGDAEQTESTDREGTVERSIPPEPTIVVVGYQKLTGLETTRASPILREGKIRCEVVKNTIAARVLRRTGSAPAASSWKARAPRERQGGNAGDVQGADRIRQEVEDSLTIRGGVMGGAALTPDGVVVSWRAFRRCRCLHAQMAGSVQAPVARVAGAFQASSGVWPALSKASGNKKRAVDPPSAPRDGSFWTCSRRGLRPADAGMCAGRSPEWRAGR